MKPDQHKKKRSAQYKRKHGTVPNKEAATPTTKVSTSKKGPTSNTDSTSTSCTNAGVIKSHSATSKIAAASSSHHDDEGFSHEESEEVRLFSRRKIESNWSRYEPLEDVDDCVSYDGLKGADYKTLLNQTGDASSQFRFKDEQLWEEDERDADKEGVVQGFPAIDCHDLADRLKGISLNIKLDIESCFFEPSVLKNLNEAAARHKERLDRQPTKETWSSFTGKPDNEPAGGNNGKILLTNSDITTEEQDAYDILLDSEVEDDAVQPTLPAEDFEKLGDYFQVTDVHESRTQRVSFVEHTESAVAELVTNGEVLSADKFECSNVENEMVKPLKTDSESHDAEKEPPEVDNEKPNTENMMVFMPSRPNSQTVTAKSREERDVSESLLNCPFTKPKEPLHLEERASVTEEDDLDFLLSLETPIQTNKPVINGGLKKSSERVKSVGGLEESTASKSQGAPVSAAGKATTSSSDILEDWLDSLLDD